VQRKILPRYLLVLDAVTAVHMLQCLARLQPPSVHASQQDSHFIQESTDSGLDGEGQVLLQLPTGHQQLVQPRQQHARGQQPSQHIQGPSLDQLAQLPTSIYAALAGSGPGVWPMPTLSQAQLAAADAAAVAAGFASATAARADFELMLSAVYTVLCAKLAQWPASVLVKLLSCAGQMQLRHEGFLLVGGLWAPGVCGRGFGSWQLGWGWAHGDGPAVQQSSGCEVLQQVLQHSAQHICRLAPACV
jgi:hypothetical protein